MIDQLKTAAAVAIVFPYALIYGIVATIADLVKPKQRATNHEPRPYIRFEDRPLDEQLYVLAENAAEWDGDLADMSDEDFYGHFDELTATYYDLNDR